MAKGRPKITWSGKDYKAFEALCSMQCTISEIESVMDVDHKTIDRLCKEHYKDSRGKPMNFSQVHIKYKEVGKMSLRRTQFKLSEKSAAMAIFLGKQILGQRDNFEAESKLASDEEFEAMVKALRGETNDDT